MSQRDRICLWGLCACLLWMMGCATKPFQKADQRALSLSTKTHKARQVGPIHPTSTKKLHSVESLTQRLVHDLREDREKARAIFRWITANIAYDVKGLRSGKYGDLSPAGVLRRRKAVCEGYASLYLKMARLAGLEAVKIHGYARTGSGKRLRRVNHAWNAVKLKGRWHLVDSTWGAGFVNGNRFQRVFKPYYFLTPPQRFLYTHWPKNPRWQLVPQPISKAAFEERVRVLPAFFTHRMGFVVPQKQVVFATHSTTIKLNIPRGVFLLTRLNWYGRSISKYRYIKVHRSGEQISIKIKFPYPGAYTFHLFASQKRNKPHQLAFKIEARVEKDAPMPKLRARYYKPCFAKGPDGKVRRQCQIFAPRSGHLPRHQPTLLKLRIPGAISAFLRLNGQDYPLLKPGDGLFTSRVVLESIGVARLFAKFKKGPTSWGTIDFFVY